MLYNFTPCDLSATLIVAVQGRVVIADDNWTGAVFVQATKGQYQKCRRDKVKETAIISIDANSWP